MKMPARERRWRTGSTNLAVSPVAQLFIEAAREIAKGAVKSAGKKFRHAKVA
jgi:hypothetical protein